MKRFEWCVVFYKMYILCSVVCIGHSSYLILFFDRFCSYERCLYILGKFYMITIIRCRVLKFVYWFYRILWVLQFLLRWLILLKLIFNSYFNNERKLTTHIYYNLKIDCYQNFKFPNIGVICKNLGVFVLKSFGFDI